MLSILVGNRIHGTIYCLVFKIKYALLAVLVDNRIHGTIYCLVFKIKYALLAQLVEQLPLKEMVGGSIPSRGTKKIKPIERQGFIFLCPVARQLLVLREGSEKLFVFRC